MDEPIAKYNLYAIQFGTSFAAGRIAFVSSDSPQKANSLLEKHLIEVTSGSNFPITPKTFERYKGETAIFDMGVKINEEKIILSTHNVDNYLGEKIKF